jgi:dipeptidyl-peptidase-4
MRLLFLSLFLFITALLPGQKLITLEDIWVNGTFSAKGVPGFNFRNDGVHYTRLNDKVIEEYDLRTGQRSGTVLDAGTIPETAGWTTSFDTYAFSPDETKLLLASNVEPIYRWSSKADYFVYDLRTKTLTQLHQGSKQRYATFSPDGSKIAYVVDNNLFYKDLTSGQTTQVTRDGKLNEIINGASDWVYEEEFELVRAFQWSPDSRRLAFLRFDEREVPEMTMEIYRGEMYPELVTFKYPKVGEKNAVVTAWLYELGGREPKAIDTGAGADDYLPRLAWTPAGQVCLTWMNRHQNHLKFLLVDPASGRTTTLFEEKSKYYLDLKEPTFLADGSGFILSSEKTGYNHLYRYDMQGREQKALTKGNWEVTAFYGVDEKNDVVFYQAASKSPMQRELYSVKLNGKKTQQLSGAAGSYSAEFSSTHDYYINTFSTLNAPPQYAVYDRRGKLVRQLEPNAALAAKQAEYGVRPAEFFSFKTSENVDLNGFMIKPVTALGTAPEKHPVLMFVYGGPGSQQVLDAWKGANYWWFQMLAQQGYVVVCVDNRGTGGRGEEFRKMTYLQLGKYETQDQIEAAKYIGTLPFADPARVGIFGWSYGGYMSSLAMLKGEEVFKAGIAVAPVTNWKWYDSIYTERYMRTHSENEQGYEENSPANFADRLKGNYLLVHGLADDNVHFQHSAEMSNRLIAANKQFDTMFYPNRNHGISGGNAKIHLYTMMTNFLNDKLKGKELIKTPRP